MSGYLGYSSANSVRVDKWLWAARMFKTRTLATSAAKAGHVKVNGNVAKSSLKVKSGDNVVALTPGGKRILEVIALAETRGPATFAQTLYIDHTPEPEPDIAPPRFERGQGRPTKKDRRKLQRFKRGF